jgi:solute:Na+ symporter, SSS family
LPRRLVVIQLRRSPFPGLPATVHAFAPAHVFPVPMPLSLPLAFLGKLSPVQLVILAAYFVLLLGIAFAFRKLNQDGDDYFRSGSQGSWWLVGMSTYMASFSAYTFTGLAGAAYIAGFSASSNFIANVIGFALNGLFLAAWLRQLRVTTTPEVIRDRFGPSAEQLYSWVGNVFGILYAAMTLYTLCIFASTAFGLPLILTIIVIGVVVMFYSLLGGRWAVMGADFVQGMVLIPITVLLSFLCLRAIGGLEGFFGTIERQQLWDDFKFFKEPRADLNYNFTAPWVFATTIALLTDRLSLSAAPRYFSCRDGRHASGAGWLVAALMVGSTVVFFLPPMVGRMLLSDVVAAAPIPQPAEAAYAIVSLHFLPETLMGLMVVAIFSATLSTMDTGLNLFSAVFAKNIYPAICRWRGTTPVTGRSLMRVGQVLTFFSGCAIIGLACYFAAAKGKGAFDLMLELGALLGVPMSVPLVLGLFSRRAPRRAAMWSMTLGFATSTTGYLTGKSLWVAEAVGSWTYDQKVFATLAAGATGYLLSYLARPDAPEIRARTEEFYRRMHTPVDFAREVGAKAGNHGQARILGWFSTAVGVGVALLALPESAWVWDGRLGVMAIATFQLLIGAVLLYAGRRR